MRPSLQSNYQLFKPSITHTDSSNLHIQPITDWRIPQVWFFLFSHNNRLSVPVPSPRRRNLRNSNNSPISRNYQHYKSMMPRRANRRHKKFKNTLSPCTAHGRDTAHIPHTHLQRYNTYNSARVHTDSTLIPPKPMPMPQIQTQTFHTPSQSLTRAQVCVYIAISHFYIVYFTQTTQVRYKADNAVMASLVGMVWTWIIWLFWLIFERRMKKER